MDALSDGEGGGGDDDDSFDDGDDDDRKCDDNDSDNDNDNDIGNDNNIGDDNNIENDNDTGNDTDIDNDNYIEIDNDADSDNDSAIDSDDDDQDETAFFNPRFPSLFLGGNDGGAGYGGGGVRYEFALVLKPNDEYRDAVEVLELALAMGEGAGSGGGRKLSPQKLNDARRVRESLDVLQPPNRETCSELGGKLFFTG